MKIFLFIALLLASFVGFSQTETHVFVTYDTLFNFSGLQWQVRISRPANLFTSGSPDTASRPAMFYMPGQGQQGNTDSNNLTAYGPHRQYNPYTGGNGWDGGFQFGNGKHYPMYFTCAFINNVTPNPSYYYQLVNYLITHYHVKASATYLCGFSEGAFTSGGFIEYEATLGDHAGMKLITAMFIEEGTPTSPANEFPPRTQNCSTAFCDTNYYVTWLNTYHGRYAYLEGSGSDNNRDGWHYSLAMNNSVPGSAYFSYENAGGGAHCCWDSLESIYQIHWRSVTPLGTYNSPSQAGTNTMGTYIDGQSMFKWLFTQGDTSLVGGGATPPTVSAGSNQTITLPTSSVTLAGSASANTPATSIVTYLWTQLSGPNTGTFSSTSITGPTFSGLVAGTYVLNLKATDNNSNVNNAQVTITVNSNGCRAFTWGASVNTIDVSDANVGASPRLTRCDTVYLPTASSGNGYRSFSADKVGLQNMSGTGRIEIIPAPGANVFITPNSSGNLFANHIDSCNWLHIKGITMNDHTDPFMSYFGITGHNHHIFFDSITLRHTPGFFISGDPNQSLPVFTNTANDTINMHFDIRFHKIFIDSVGDAVNGGLSAIYIGGMEPKNVWFNVEVDSSIIDRNYSSSGPAADVHMSNSYLVRVHDNIFKHMGVVTNPIGHASVVSVEHSLHYTYRNKFINNFGNCVRAISQGTIPILSTIALSIDPTYDGVSRFYDNIDDSSRKYPMIEDQMDTLFQSPIASYYQFKRSARIWNNTMYFPGVGAGNSAYDASLVDWYDGTTWVDTIEFHNNVEVGPLNDTTPTVGNVFFHYFMFPNGIRSGHIDSANNSFFQASILATGGLANATNFNITNTGPLYNTGGTVPSWLTTDFYKAPRPTVGRSPGVDIGAVQFIPTIIPNIPYILVRRGTLFFLYP